MSDTTILELTTASVVSETEDFIPMVDVSDTTESNDGTTKRATVRKLLKDKALPSGDIVGTSDEQTLEGKTLAAPVITDADITGGSVSATTNVVEVLKKVYPVGCIYTSTVSTNPNTLFGFGTWSEYGQGRVLVGKSAEAEFDTIGETGGAKTHVHRQGGPSSDSSGSGGGSISGPWNDGTFGRSSSGVHFGNYSQIVSSGIGSSKTVYPFLTESTSSLQPYIVVYFWQRTA